MIDQVRKEFDPLMIDVIKRKGNSRGQMGEYWKSLK
jgi:hypothetical protein